MTVAHTAEVTLQVASPSDATLLANLLELYVHDLSEVFAIDVRADGRFGYDKLDLYWSEPASRFAFVIRCGEQIAGFAFATRGSPADDDPDAIDVAEFFVLRRYRRSSAGRRAAALLWDRFPGCRWVVRVSEGNLRGLPFWRAVVGEYTRGRGGESARPGTPHPWRVFTFRSAPRPATPT